MATETTPAPRWCDLVPRTQHQRLPGVDVPDSWFVVYRLGDGVFAIGEPFQFQEVISYLILGSKSALLFDTGLGIGRIDRVVKALTPLPVTVLNSPGPVATGGPSGLSGSPGSMHASCIDLAGNAVGSNSTSSKLVL